MNVLILGSGGREHTLAWKINQSPLIQNLFVAPGNAGTLEIATNLPLNVNDFEAIKVSVLEEQIDMVIVGPEDPLVNGIHDFFLNDNELQHVSIIGPQKEAANLEGSKEFAKKFMIKHRIPTAAYKSFSPHDLNSGYEFLETLNPPYVLKADGLAAGKGVLILKDLQTAKMALKDMLVDAKFGSASKRVVIEEFLDGIELSCFVLTDGEHYKVLPTAKDYKRIGEGDTGLNTGGMGAISPPPFIDNALMDKIKKRIVIPTIEGLQEDHIKYVGFIFIGLIRVGDDPFVIEYNARLGDPETEVIIPRIENDLLQVFDAVAKGQLDRIDIKLDPRVTTTVMAVSGGYPESYEKGKEITGINAVQDATVFHAGTRQLDNKIYTNGGRVLAVTAIADTMHEALEKSYANLELIQFNDMYYRKDIGFDL